MAGNQDIFLVQSQFDELVALHGKTAIWQAAFRCSCWTIQNGGSGEPLYTCAACGGTGYIYQSPVTSKIILQGIDQKRDFLPAGTWMTGDIVASIPFNQMVETPGETGNIVTWAPHPMWAIGIGDLISLRDSEQRGFKLLIRDQPMWNLAANTLPFPADNIVRIIDLLVADPNTGAVTHFTQGVQGTDYTVDGGGTVTWTPASTADYMVNGNVIVFNPIGANAVNLPAGAQYSVTFTHYATYIVYMDLPVPRDQDAQHLPRKVMLRLKDVGV